MLEFSTLLELVEYIETHYSTGNAYFGIRLNVLFLIYRFCCFFGKSILLGRILGYL